jgi:hypothetical protein
MLDKNAGAEREVVGRRIKINIGAIIMKLEKAEIARSNKDNRPRHNPCPKVQRHEIQHRTVEANQRNDISISETVQNR